MSSNRNKFLSFSYRNLLLAVLLSITCRAPALAETEIAWLDSNAGTIKRTINGSTITLQSSLTSTYGLGLSDQCELYFSTGMSIYRTTTAIGAAKTLFRTINGITRSIVADNQFFYSTQSYIASLNTQGFSDYSPSALATYGSPVSKLYWMDSGHRLNQSSSVDAVRRANFDGTSTQSMVSTVAGRGIAIDKASDWVYWAENKSPVTIKRAHGDGSGTETVLSSGFHYITHLAYGGNRLYALDADGTLKVINPQVPSVSTFVSDVEAGGGIVTIPDTDGDGETDCDETCPTDATKLAPGVCGCGTPDTDTDSDGTANCIDACPSDSTKIAVGACGCGVPDTDGDSDGTANCLDLCPADASKIAAGVCGCGIADTDSDGDGTANCLDQCPSDPLKTAPGICGCGSSEADIDGDGTVACQDQCPLDSHKIAVGVCGCGIADTDTDGDGIPNCNDQCPLDAANVSPGTCGCGIADTDTDGDGTVVCLDQCPLDATKTVPGSCGCGVPDTDTDGDGVFDCHEQCPSDPLKFSAGVCGCGIADKDTDGDSALDCNDQCVSDPNKTAPGKCGCNKFEVKDGDRIICSDDREIKKNVVPEEADLSTRQSCQVAVVFEKLADTGGDVRYSLVVTKKNSSKAILSLSGLPAKYLLTLPKAGSYQMRYKAVLTKNRKKVFETKLSEPSDIELSSNNCRKR